MRRKVFFIVRQLLIGILAMQLLNLSICTEQYLEYYNYTACDNRSNDPTETILEWVVESKYGQQDAFNYTNKPNTKTINKTFHWQLAVDEHHIPVIYNCRSGNRCSAPVTSELTSVFMGVESPPPEYPVILINFSRSFRVFCKRI